MKSTITFFPVDNGDMTLIKLSDNTTILIDINLRDLAEDEEDPSFDAVKGLSASSISPTPLFMAILIL